MAKTKARAAGESKAKVQALAKAGQAAMTAASRRAEELLALIARRKQRISEDFFEIGLALQEIRKKGLYRALGFASFAAMLSARKVMSVRAADKLVDIVSSMKRDQALELGQEKAYALARLVAATPEPETVADVVADGAVIRGKKVAVKDLSTREIKAVAAKARPRRVDPAAREAKSAARALQSAARARGAKHATVAAERRGGGVWVQLSGPLAELEALVAGKRSRAAR